MSDIFDSSAAEASPALVILYMIDEATRRTDLNADGEFGMNGKQIWYDNALIDRLDEYIERLITTHQTREDPSRSGLKPTGEQQ